MSKSSEGFISFITGVSIIGVAVGVLALVVVTSVVNGFEGELTRAITGMNGDVILYSRGNPISTPRLIEEKIKQVVPEVQAVTASFVTELMVSGQAGVAGAVLEGVDTTTLNSVVSIEKRFQSGRMPQSMGEVALGSALADRIGAAPGDKVRLIAPFVGESFESNGSLGSPKVLEAYVSGIFKMGFYQYDSKYIISPIATVQAFLSQPEKVTTFKMKLQNKADPVSAANRLTENFGYPFRAKDWGQLNRNLLYAIRLEKVVIAIILTAITVVAAFNVISALMMMIHDKGREIAILKAMGMGRASSFSLFIWIGTFIGVVGSLAGVAVGLGVNRLIEKTRIIKIPADIYYIGFLPVVVRWEEIVMISFFGVLVSFAATLYPAMKVAVRSPLEGLRDS